MLVAQDVVIGDRGLPVSSGIRRTKIQEVQKAEPGPEAGISGNRILVARFQPVDEIDAKFIA